MNPQLQALLMALVAAALGLAGGIFLQNRLSKAAAIRDLDLRLDAIEKDVARLGTQMSPLWARVQKQIAGELHHPHPRYKEMDTLLEELEALTISEAGRKRLKELLLLRSVDTHADITPEQRLSAKILISVMDKVLAEAQEEPGP